MQNVVTWTMTQMRPVVLAVNAILTWYQTEKTARFAVQASLLNGKFLLVEIQYMSVRDTVRVAVRNYQERRVCAGPAQKLVWKERRDVRGRSGSVKKRYEPRPVSTHVPLRPLLMQWKLRKKRKDKDTSNEANDGIRNKPALRRE